MKKWRNGENERGTDSDIEPNGDTPMVQNKAETGPSMEWREAIEFLLRVAAIESPETLREGDRLNLVEDLGRYLEVEVEGVAKKLSEARSKPAIIRPVIDVVRQLVAAAADHARVEVSKGPTRFAFDGSRLGQDREEREPLYFIDGDLRDLMAESAAVTVADLKPWEICRCPQCRKLFLAGRKGQMFCSHECASTASLARFQERKKSKSKKGGR
jgi:hypothetical protein